MATSRSQLSEQIRQLQGGGTPLGMTQDLRQGVKDALAVDTNQLRADVGLESREQERLNALRALLSQRSSATMQSKNFQDSFTKYKNQLMQIYGSRPRTSIFDLASTVGGAMLAADPTTGAFRSVGLGFAKFAEEERARRERDLAESRAIGLKAFELAKSDEDQAQKLINEFELLRAKQRLDTKVEQVIVTDPAGITVDGKFYEQGSRPLLTDSEKFAYRAQISDAPSPQSGVKVTAAGAIARWQTKEDAEKTIEGLGLSRDSEFLIKLFNNSCQTTTRYLVSESSVAENTCSSRRTQ